MSSSCQKVTFCRICEPFCGMVASVKNGKVEKLRPDAENPISKGFACAKGIAMTEVQNDVDRVTYPLKKTESGEFERVSWDTALADIAKQLNRVRATHGNESLGWYLGNPAGANYAHLIWTTAFIKALGTPHFYSVGSQDQNSRLVASTLLYGSPFLFPIPDLERTSFLLMIGANPRVSQGSGISFPRIREAINGIEQRGGRVVVVDPRKTPTAGAHEWLPINPDTDALMLLSILQVIFEEKLEDTDTANAIADDVNRLRTLCAEFGPEKTAELTGIAVDALRQIARDVANAETAAVYGRVGSCVGRFGTLVSFLIDAVNIVTGNIDRRGGAVFSDPPIGIEALVQRFGLATYATRRSRIGGLPEVLGQMPATVMAREITTPGKGQLRALIVSAGNPVLSCANGNELEAAFGKLDLLVSIDLYVNETNKHADYILPATTFLEREDFPLFALTEQLQPFIQTTKAVVEPRGAAREEWKIIDEIAMRMGISIFQIPGGSRLAKIGVKPTPRQLVDILIRTSPQGDWFGIRRNGLSLAKLDSFPHGLKLSEEIKTGVLLKKISHKSRKINLCPPEIRFEVRRLRVAMSEPTDLEYPLRLIGMREPRSHNSWMHNSQKLMRGDRGVHAWVNARDADCLGIEEGDRIAVRSKTGMISLPAYVTEEIKAGTVAIPHGWGHQGGGWRIANSSGAPNINLLASTQLSDIERLAGMTHLSGIPINIERLNITTPE